MKSVRFLLCSFVFACSFNIQAQNIDIHILKKIHLNRNKSMDPACRFISNSTAPMVMGVPLAFITTSLIKKDSTLTSKTITICLTSVTAGIITTSLKYMINRKRPFVTYPFIEKAGSASTASFPSGHASSSFALASAVSLMYPEWYVIVPSFLCSAVTAYTRMHLGVHYPSDVLAGAIIGSGSVFLSHQLNILYQKRNKRK